MSATLEFPEVVVPAKVVLSSSFNPYALAKLVPSLASTIGVPDVSLSLISPPSACVIVILSVVELYDADT